jgi:hypothetical protein
MTKPKVKVKVKTQPPSDGQLIADAITRVFECAPPAGSGLNVANGLYAVARSLDRIAGVIAWPLERIAIAAASGDDAGKPIMCRQCRARAVEDSRRDYATPVCFACLPPPDPLPIAPLRSSTAAEHVAEPVAAAPAPEPAPPSPPAEMVTQNGGAVVNP